MGHIGLVVTDMQLSDVVIRNYVLEFIVDADNECSHELAQVGEPAFRFEANGAYDPAYIKNQKRRLERPLNFGDMIEWDDRDITNRIILKIRRVPKLFESRIYEGRSQVCVTGVVSPTNKFLFWSQYFPCIKIDTASSKEVLPNVSVSAWLNIAIDSNSRLCIEFDSFEKVECEANVVALAPWNRNHSKYTTLTIPLNDDDIENQIVEPDLNKYKGGWKQELYNYEGICTGGRLLYCNKLPTYEIIVALIKNAKDFLALETGVNCEFDAVWNDFEKRFIVTRYKTKSRILRLALNGLMKTTVKAIEGYPCVFKSDDLGLIDDPNGALSLLHLSPYCKSSVVVSLSDSPSMISRFRFRVVDVQPDKGPKLEKWMKENMISVTDAKGVVIDSSTIYSRDNGSIFFFIPENLKSGIFVGLLVKFSAVYDLRTKQFVVSHVSSTSREISFIEKRMLHFPPEHQKKQKIFRVLAKRAPRELDCLLECDEFGLLDVGTHINLTKDNSPKLVWVMRSLPDVDQTCRPSRTPFIVVGAGDREPEGVAAEESVEEFETPKSSMEKSGSVSAEATIEAAMQRMGLTEKKPHSVDCSDDECAPGCPHMEMIMLMIDTVPDFLENIAFSDPALYTKLANSMFS